jgi:anthranilate/para-aminobenzoate synthase component I
MDSYAYIRTEPIKGTMRFADAQDEGSKRQLIDGDKDRSENVMIVDLLRMIWANMPKADGKSTAIVRD